MVNQARKSVPKDRWIIIAPGRGDRPFDFSKPEKEATTDCPFCEGNEDRTPPEVFAIRHKENPNGRGWKVRVFSNKYPALNEEEVPYVIEEDLVETMGGYGRHEVVVETPKHRTRLEELDPDEIKLVLMTYRARYRELISDPDIRYVSIFKNNGLRAGASLSHPHSQILATPFVPALQLTELNNTKDFYDQMGRCYYCNLIDSELSEGVRIVAENDRFLVLSPYAARFPFELHIIPKTHESNFSELTHDGAREFSNILKATLIGLKEELGEFPYNYSIHTAPGLADGENKFERSYHWHVEIMPRLTNPAGFEWGSGNYINTVAPEDAADRVRTKFPKELLRA